MNTTPLAIVSMKLFVTATALFSAGLLHQAEAATVTHGSDSVDIDFVEIGNAGNAVDATTGFGAVSYDYKIGTYEVTAQQWVTVTSFDADIATGSQSNAWTGSQPTAKVSWYEAAKFANWLTSGNALLGAYQFSDATTFTGVDRDAALETYQTVYVLPSEDEWYKAAYFKSEGSGYTLYPTGDTAPTVGVEANYSSGSSPWDVGAGAIENNATYDMGGNVWEWNESTFSGGEPTGSESRVNRGAHWGRIGSSMQSSARGSASPTTEADYVGFRIAALELQVIPEPSSVGLLFIGAMGCVWRRKRS